MGERGRLKIYLGFAPGVGKTFTMLREAQYLKKNGQDVVIGWLEDKDRRDTLKMAEGLELVPPKVVEYRGAKFPELNVEAIVRRKPELVVIDEFAHRNVPGACRKRRYQDVEYIREQGIDVVTTLNIQHAQGVVAAAAKITGKSVTETVPDWVINQSDEIELIDVSPYVLQQRLKEGKIFSKTMSKRSNSLFSANKLTALRELALLYVADEVDERLENYRRTQGIFTSIHLQERILVCVNSPITAARLIATGANLARNLMGELLVLYVQVAADLVDKEMEFELVQEPQVHGMVEDFINLAKKHEGRFLMCKVPSKGKIAHGITMVIKSQKVTQVVIGESGISRWREIYQGSIITKILAQVCNVDILVAGNKEGFQVKPLELGRYKPAKDTINSSGKLKIYIGASAGVGKTVAMLREAHELKLKGVDVLIGLVETHNRRETAEYADGIENIPLKSITYRGVRMYELNIPAIIERRPQVVLIDELAHTNVPGMKNAKRYQDVFEILAEGIDVISAVNIQHIESLNDIVEDLTGVVIRETVPDTVVARAEELVMIDISPENLRNRLRAGKIYAVEKIELALSNFFKQENLQVLRELALREVAQDLDGHHRNGKSISYYKKERVLVCIQLKSSAERLIRRGFRIAQRINAEFDVLHVTDGHRLSMSEAQQLDILRGLSGRLGATFHVTTTISSRQLSLHLLGFIKDYEVTKVILGQSARTRWEEILHGSIVNPILKHTTGLDILVVADPFIMERKPNGC